MLSSSISQRANAFDDRVDRAYQPLRNVAALNAVMVAASTLGDWSLIWHITSLIVNQGIKRLFRRQRPTEHGAEGLTVRKPRTSSFPSGHASAAAFSAVVLSAMTGGWWIALWAVLATAVALSRFHVRMHHATDVLAGAVVGAALAGAAIPLL